MRSVRNEFITRHASRTSDIGSDSVTLLKTDNLLSKVDNGSDGLVTWNKLYSGQLGLFSSDVFRTHRELGNELSL